MKDKIIYDVPQTELMQMDGSTVLCSSGANSSTEDYNIIDDYTWIEE